jgi:L-rhamnose isomerase/sugar isomerase
MASQTLKAAFETDVTPLIGRVRYEAGGAIDPLSAYRSSGYRERVARTRPKSTSLGGGIV